MLAQLLKQNFACNEDASFILTTLFELAGSVPAFKLTYLDVGKACDTLTDNLKNLPTPPTIKADATSTAANARPHPINKLAALIRSPDAETRELDGELFVTNHDQTRVLNLNQDASMIWILLEEPATEEDAVTIIQTAFPDTNPAEIKADTERVFAQFRKTGLVIASDAI
ncbi:PqqD family protein [Cognatiyoonia sp.]|uniref:PqqD family protein n=1 Tax=Cognatiyoonia sp. TaxID=2211652 RepID=UPI003F69DECC